MKKIVIYELLKDAYNRCVVDEGAKVEPCEIKSKICIFVDKIICVSQSETSNLMIYVDERWISYDYVPKNYGSEAIDKIIDFIDDSTNPNGTLYLAINVSDGSIMNIERRL